MPTLAIDVSNYTDQLTPESVIGVKNNGIQLAIVQAIDPPSGYPAGQTQQQILLLTTGGIIVDAYIFLWFDLGISDIQNKLNLLTPYSGKIRQIWLDVEDTAAIKYNQEDTEAKVQAALSACDAAPLSGLVGQSGIYTGKWFWADPRYMDNTQTFASRKLWDANYDGKADASVGFTPYGGWTSCAIKQYLGTSTLAGIGNLDLDVLSDEEAQSLPSAPIGSPDQQRIASLTTALGDVTGQGGEIRTALANASALTSVKSIRQALMAIDNRLAAINSQFLG